MSVFSSKTDVNQNCGDIVYNVFALAKLICEQSNTTQFIPSVARHECISLFLQRLLCNNTLCHSEPQRGERISFSLQRLVDTHILHYTLQKKFSLTKNRLIFEFNIKRNNVLFFTLSLIFYSVF